MGVSETAPAVLTVEQRDAVDEALRDAGLEELRQPVAQALAAAEQRGLDLGRADADPLRRLIHWGAEWGQKIRFEQLDNGNYRCSIDDELKVADGDDWQRAAEALCVRLGLLPAPPRSETK